MEKKHFELVAEVLKSQEPQEEKFKPLQQFVHEHNVWEEMVEAFALRFEKENSRFDEEKFFLAAGHE